MYLRLLRNDYLITFSVLVILLIIIMPNTELLWSSHREQVNFSSSCDFLRINELKRLEKHERGYYIQSHNLTSLKYYYDQILHKPDFFLDYY